MTTAPATEVAAQTGSGDLAAQVAARVRQVEARLERLFDSGWRSAAGEAAELEADAGALSDAGLAGVAKRIEAVRQAVDAASALEAVTLALAACRLLRARLSTGETLTGEWRAVGETSVRGRRPRRAAQSPDRVLPVARMALGDGEAWACIQLNGLVATGWVLVDAVPAADAEGASLAHERRNGEPVWPAWLHTLVQGRLRWKARYPLGSSGGVERCTLVDAALAEPDEASRLWLTHAAKAMGGKWRAGTTVLTGYGTLKFATLEDTDPERYTWADPATAAAFRAAAHEGAWALVWERGGTSQPLALLSPPGLLKRAALVHLVPGAPSTPLT